MKGQLCKHFIISGRVQGVWFRATTQEQAIMLGIKGWVQNMPDGNVEVFACGAEEKLQLLHNWLMHGPKLARVEKVVCEDAEWVEVVGFDIK